MKNMTGTGQHRLKIHVGMGSCTLTGMVWLLWYFPVAFGQVQDEGKAAENKKGSLYTMAWKGAHRIDSALMALENRSKTVQEDPLRSQLPRQMEPIPAFAHLDPACWKTQPEYYPEEKSPAGLPVPGPVQIWLSDDAAAAGERMLARFRPSRHTVPGNDEKGNLPFGTAGPATEMADRLEEAWAYDGMAGRPDPEALQAVLRRMRQFKRTYKSWQTDMPDTAMSGKNSLSGLTPGQRLLAGGRFDTRWGKPWNIEIHPNLLYRLHTGLTVGVSLCISTPANHGSRQNLRLGSGALLQQVVWKGFFLSGEILLDWPGRSDPPQVAEEGSRIGFRAGLGREFNHNDRLRSQLLLSYDFSKRGTADSPLRIGMGFGFPLRRP
jgi:hypothetical protein